MVWLSAALRAIGSRRNTVFCRAHLQRVFEMSFGWRGDINRVHFGMFDDSRASEVENGTP
jgi:hypothetical protein